MEEVDKQFVVGVDVGGQTSKIGVVDARGDVLAQTVIRSDTYGKERSIIYKSKFIRFKE